MAATKLEIQRREPVLGGRAFGSAGAYEKIEGTLRFGVDPKHPIHADITDLPHAPRNAVRKIGEYLQDSGKTYLVENDIPDSPNEAFDI